MIKKSQFQIVIVFVVLFVIIAVIRRIKTEDKEYSTKNMNVEKSKKEAPDWKAQLTEAMREAESEKKETPPTGKPPIDKTKEGIIYNYNRKQKIVICSALIIIFIMGIYPPWNYTFKRKGIYSEKPAGYHFLFEPPKSKRNIASGITVDFSRLFLQWFMVILAGTIIIIFLRMRNKE